MAKLPNFFSFNRDDARAQRTFAPWRLCGESFTDSVLKLAREMEINLREIILHHLQPRLRLRHEHQLAIFVQRDVTLLARNELRQFLFVRAADPTSFVN